MKQNEEQMDYLNRDIDIKKDIKPKEQRIKIKLGDMVSFKNKDIGGFRGYGYQPELDTLIHLGIVIEKQKYGCWKIVLIGTGETVVFNYNLLTLVSSV